MDDRSLEEIEGDAWGDPPPDATGLVSTVYRLRRRPLAALRPGDLRVLLGQRVGVVALLPLALDLLEREPLLEGDRYPSDLLAAALRAPDTHWSAHPDQRARMARILAALDPDMAEFASHRTRFPDQTT